MQTSNDINTVQTTINNEMQFKDTSENTDVSAK